ncbi:MAG: HAMP domain-containing histidine kinase [Spirochaetaceae bacterium]|nr:MAG: HAMP domain-containing histidine kinase [Spirochaetaceae bacterium]
MVSFFSRFSVKVSSLFLVLLLLMGSAQVIVTMRITERRQIEVDQLVNWNLAQDMAAEIEPVLAADGNMDGIGEVIHYMMVLNPAIEIYLLDGEGTILGFFAEPGKEVKARTVDLEPVRRFISGGGHPPIFGEDPRGMGAKKHFSAATIALPDGSRGYLYIVLRSTLYDLAAGRLRDKYLASALVRALVLSGISVAIVGLILFTLLTRRLQRVARSVREFEQGNYHRRLDTSAKDEIGELARTYNRMADTIAANLEKLKETDSLRRELIANVSHDLRSPLTSIQGYVETLLMKHDSLSRKQLRTYLQVILSDATMLNEMVHELFELSKYEARQIEPRLERFSLTELIQDVVLKYKPRAEEREVMLEAGLPEKLFFVQADINMIERVLSNLIENALAHTPTGGQVRAQLEEREGRALVRVNDSGKGIEKQDIPFIFDRFFTSGRERASSDRGSGLGLAIAQKIMGMHASRIQVESEPGRGSTFYFELPLDQARH